MKKQVISFLALFGLVFVLSIYYVLLPTNLFIKSNNIDDNKVINVNMTVDETSNLFFATLNSKLNKKHNDTIYNYESIVASSSQSNEEKETALNNLSFEYKIIQSEEQIVSLIKEKGYTNAYVEYQEDMIKVIVQAQSLNNEEAAMIISLVIESSIGNLLPEVEYVA
ncbi:MAG: SpoIIIAH-like family protein [Erysipelotrichaceae bacterium]|nr:SpoIIIAH-like family protein [Erysipelotrichaceae bacterium]